MEVKDKEKMIVGNVLNKEEYDTVKGRIELNHPMSRQA